MIGIVFAHDGTLDRVVGDPVAIVFSTPVEPLDAGAGTRPPTPTTTRPAP